MSVRATYAQQQIEAIERNDLDGAVRLAKVSIVNPFVGDTFSFNSSGILINVGNDRADKKLNQVGMQIAEASLANQSTTQEYQARAQYNLSNGYAALAYVCETLNEQAGRSQNWRHQRGIAQFTAKSHDNVHLTRWVLLQSILNSANTEQSGDKLKVRIHESVELEMGSYREGADIFIIEPYFLKADQVFGIVVDFPFRKNPDVPFSRLIQQRSLSLTSQFRRNFNFHLDKSSRIKSYLERSQNVLGAVKLPGSADAILFSHEFSAIQVRQLAPRRYRFGNNGEEGSQYAGVKQFGPDRATPLAGDRIR